MRYRIPIGTLVAALVMFFWGFVFWGLMPIAYKSFHAVPQPEPLAEALRENIPAPGVYFIPFPCDTKGLDADQKAAATKAHEQAHAEGPVAMLYVHPKGVPQEMAVMMIRGFGLYALMSFLAAVLLTLTAPALPTFAHRYVLVMFLGLVIATSSLTDAVWFYHPIDYRVMITGYALTGWLLAGVALAAIVKHPAAAKSA